MNGRIGFVFLRISGSPPVALHLLSRERSYLRLQAGCTPGEDFHLANLADSPAHWGARSAGSAPEDAGAERRPHKLYR